MTMASSPSQPCLLTMASLSHVLRARVRPITQTDFYVQQKVLGYSSFFTWQPRAIIDLLQAERRDVMMAEVEEWEHGPRAGDTHDDSFAVDVRLGPQPADRKKLIEYMEAKPNFLVRGVGSKGRPKKPNSAKYRATLLTGLLKRLFDGADKVTVVPMASHDHHAKLSRVLVTYSGKETAGASMLILGSEADVRSRSSGFRALEEDLQKRELPVSPDEPNRRVGPLQLVQGDEHFWAARANVCGGLWEKPEFAHSAAMLSLSSMASVYGTMLQGDPRKSVKHAANAKASLREIAEEIAAQHPEWDLKKLNIAEMSKLVSMSFQEYDNELKKLEETDRAALQRLLALADEETWEIHAETYPTGKFGKHEGKPLLSQPDLGDENTWYPEYLAYEEAKDDRMGPASCRRHENLLDQAQQCQRQVKSKFLRSALTLSREEMDRLWPKFRYLSGKQMESWGGGEAFDPGIKGGARLFSKARSKYRNDFAQMKDVARFSIYYGTPSALMEGLKKLRSGFTIVRIENRFRKPTVLGWRDVTILLEETLEGGEQHGKRFLVEVQLQLTGYAAVRQTAHHYYEIVREKIAAVVGGRQDQQDALLIVLLDAIVGEASRVSGKLLDENHKVLHDVYTKVFGEVLAEATCLLRKAPKELPRYEAEPYSLQCDVQLPDHQTSLNKQRRLKPHFARAHRLMERAASRNVSIRLTIDSCMRKLNLGDFSSFGPTSLQAAALAILGSEDMTRPRPGQAQRASELSEMLLGRVHDSLRLGDVLVDLEGTVWCCILDGAPMKSCSLSPIAHELVLTYASVPISGVEDLLEGWNLTVALVDLDFGAISDDGIAEFVQPPPDLETHRAQQSFVAAASMRQFAWMYCGSQARASGAALDLVNLQHASLLASRYVLSDAFAKTSSTSLAWAALSMLLSYDRASGASHAIMDAAFFRALAAERGAMAAEAMMDSAIGYFEAQSTRAWIRKDPDTGRRPCDAGGDLPPHPLSDLANDRAKPKAQHQSEQGEGPGGAEERSIDGMPPHGRGTLRLPKDDFSNVSSDALHDMDPTTFQRLEREHNNGVRSQLLGPHWVYNKDYEVRGDPSDERRWPPPTLASLPPPPWPSRHCA